MHPRPPQNPALQLHTPASFAQTQPGCKFPAVEVTCLCPIALGVDSETPSLTRSAPETAPTSRRHTLSESESDKAVDEPSAQRTQPLPRTPDMARFVKLASPCYLLRPQPRTTTGLALLAPPALASTPRAHRGLRAGVPHPLTNATCKVGAGKREITYQARLSIFSLLTSPSSKRARTSSLSCQEATLQSQPQHQRQPNQSVSCILGGPLRAADTPAS